MRELLQDLTAHYGVDHQTEAIHNEVIIEGKLAANVPVALELVRELMSVLWKSVKDVHVMLELLIFLVSLGMLLQVL